jgi:hypothetical protein
LVIERLLLVGRWDGWYNSAMNYEINENGLLMPEEIYFRETGVCRYSLVDGPEVVGVSGNTWEEYVGLLYEVSPGDKYVVSPELITCTGMDFEDMIGNIDLINQRIESVIDFSNNFSETIFVLGTPLFVDENRPRNSVLLIKNGEIIGVTNKRSGATVAENRYFDLIAEESPFLLPGTQTALLICADLPTATLYTNPNNENILLESLRLSKREHLIGKKVELLPSSATSLVVVACWGVGGQWAEPGKEDFYYGMQLRNIAWRIMRETNIKEVVVVDRSQNNLIKPFNSHFRLLK